MESLKDKCWRVIKQTAIEKKRVRKTFSDIKKEMMEGGKTIDNRIRKDVEEVASVVGWIDIVKDRWKIEKKKEMWEDIHRDIVSTIM